MLARASYRARGTERDRSLQRRQRVVVEYTFVRFAFLFANWPRPITHSGYRRLYHIRASRTSAAPPPTHTHTRTIVHGVAQARGRTKTSSKQHTAISQHAARNRNILAHSNAYLRIPHHEQTAINPCELQSVGRVMGGARRKAQNKPSNIGT